MLVYMEQQRYMITWDKLIIVFSFTLFSLVFWIRSIFNIFGWWFKSIASEINWTGCSQSSNQLCCQLTMIPASNINVEYEKTEDNDWILFRMVKYFVRLFRMIIETDNSHQSFSFLLFVLSYRSMVYLYFLCLLLTFHRKFHEIFLSSIS